MDVWFTNLPRRSLDQWLASLTEFSMIGSELCFLFFTFNFVLILRNPFLHIRRLMKKYLELWSFIPRQYPVILLVSLAYGIALPFFQVQSNSPFGHCWIHTESTFFDTYIHFCWQVNGVEIWSGSFIFHSLSSTLSLFFVIFTLSTCKITMNLNIWMYILLRGKNNH